MIFKKTFFIIFCIYIKKIDNYFLKKIYFCVHICKYHQTNKERPQKVEQGRHETLSEEEKENKVKKSLGQI